jgi:hypothetical protein
MTKLLDGVVLSLAVIAIVLALPSVIWGAFWLMYSFWHYLGVM